MEYLPLGKTGLRVSRFCLGTLTLGPLAADLELQQGAALILAALRHGVTFLDTAEQYRTYPYIRAALEQWDAPDQIVIASKTYAWSDREAAWAIEDARLALGRETLDVMLLHEVRDREDFQARSGAWQALRDARQNGVIRAIGLSTHSAAVAAWAAEQPELDVMMVLLNRDGIGIRDGDRETMTAAAALARQHGKGVYGMKAIAGGGLMHEARSALNWAFSRDELDAVAVGCKDVAELATDLAWIEGREAAEAAQVRLLDRNIVFDKEPRCHGCRRCIMRCPAGAMRLGDDGLAEWQKQQCLYCGYCIAACPWFCIAFC